MRSKEIYFCLLVIGISLFSQLSSTPSLLELYPTNLKDPESFFALDLPAPVSKLSEIELELIKNISSTRAKAIYKILPKICEHKFEDPEKTLQSIKGIGKVLAPRILKKLDLEDCPALLLKLQENAQ